MPETTYTYNLSADFVSGKCLTEDLYKEIKATAGITTALVNVALRGDTVDVVFADALSAGEKTLLDGDTLAPAGGLLAANYNLDKIKALKTAELSAAVNAYVYKHYEPHRQTSFNALMIESVQEGWLNRYAYIESGFAWVKKVISSYYTHAYAISVQPNIAAVDAYTWDLETAFDSGPDGDPAITIYAASTQVETPKITSALTANGVLNTPIANYTITGEAGPRAPVSYNATDLPAGLTVATSTGVISGTPTETGAFDVEISATNTAGTDSATLVLTIAAA